MVGDRVGQPQMTRPDAQVLCDGERVQAAFSLGWHVTELYHFEKLRRDVDDIWRTSAETSARAAPSDRGGARKPDAADKTGYQQRDALPGIGSLSDDDRRTLLVRQIRHDLTQVWVLAAEPPDAVTLGEELAAAEELPTKEFRRRVAVFHQTLLSGLTVTDFRLGKSYGLARALAESTILPSSAAVGERQRTRAVGAAPDQHPPETDTGAAGEKDSPQRDRMTEFQRSLWEEFGSGRVAQVQGWLYDLRDCFPTHAADAVATTLGGWSVWMIRPTMRDGHPVDWDQDDRDSVERSLRRQGDVWRGLLSGEKDPMGMLTSDYYFAAVRSLLARITRLGLRFLGTGAGFVLFLIVLVAGIALYASTTTRNGTGILAAVITFLGSLGITTGSAWAAVQKALTRAEDPLWSAELAAAVAQVTWHNPAAMGSIDEIQLLLTIGSTPDPAAETRARHPRLTALRNLPVGRVGVALIVASTAVGLFGAGAGWFQQDAAFFLVPLCIVGFLAVIDGWDLLIGFASRQRAPYLALPERIDLPAWAGPLAGVLAPVLLVVGLLAGHYFWH